MRHACGNFFAAGVKTHFGSQIQELLQAQPAKPALVLAQIPQDLLEEPNLARKNQTPAALEPELLLRHLQQCHEHRQVQEPRRDQEPPALRRPHVDRQETVGNAAAGIRSRRRRVGVGDDGAAAEAEVLPAEHELLEPDDLADLVDHRARHWRPQSHRSEQAKGRKAENRFDKNTEKHRC